MTTKMLHILFDNPTLLAHYGCSQTIAGSNKEFRNHNVAVYRALGGNHTAAYKGSSHKVAAKWNDDPAPYIHSPDYVCIACGKPDTSGRLAELAHLETSAKVETTPQTDQPFDALQFLIECRNFKKGKWFTKHNGKSVHVKHTAARHLREQNGMGKDASIEMVKQLSRQVECMDTKPVETKEDTAAQTLKFIQRISPPRTKPAPKPQAKPVPQADGSIEVMDAELFARLAKAVSVEMMTIEIETITVNGKVFRCA